MTIHSAVVNTLVVVGVAAQVVCCVGLLAGRTALDRLHYAGAASTVGPFAVAAAVIVEQGFLTSAGLNVLAAAVLMFVLNAALTHATARIAWKRPER